MTHFRLIAVFVSFLSICTPLWIIKNCQAENSVESRVSNKNIDMLLSIEDLCKAAHETAHPLNDDSQGKSVLPCCIQDQQDASNNEFLISTLPLKHVLIEKDQLDRNRISRPRIRKIKIPKIKVPKTDQSLRSPKLRPLMPIDTRPYVKANPKQSEEEGSSVDKLESFKRGLQKMLHVVKVLGKIDQYLSDRIRIVVEKISKVIAE